MRVFCKLKTDRDAKNFSDIICKYVKVISQILQNKKVGRRSSKGKN